MKLEKLNLKEVEIKRSEMAAIKGGTSTTEFTQTGYTEIEQELNPITRKPIGKPILIEFPDSLSRLML